MTNKDWLNFIVGAILLAILDAIGSYFLNQPRMTFAMIIAISAMFTVIRAIREPKQ